MAIEVFKFKRDLEKVNKALARMSNQVECCRTLARVITEDTAKVSTLDYAIRKTKDMLDDDHMLMLRHVVAEANTLDQRAHHALSEFQAALAFTNSEERE